MRVHTDAGTAAAMAVAVESGAQLPGTAWLDGLPAGEAARELAACCASTRWTRQMTAARPYRTGPALLDAALAALNELAWSDVLEALAAHPMIGQRAGGHSKEATWSRSEQAGMADVARDVAAQMTSLNSAYQEKFGHVFLICASGLPPEVILRALRHRLRNDAATERLATRAELAAIVRLRLERLLRSAADAAEDAALREASA